MLAPWKADGPLGGLLGAASQPLARVRTTLPAPPPPPSKQHLHDNGQVIPIRSGNASLDGMGCALYYVAMGMY